MCCNCTAKQKQWWLWGCSAFVLVFAVVLAILWPSLFGVVLKKELELREGSPTYQNWIKTPLPMYAEFYMFNWTNPHEVLNHSTKPHFVEMGPYVFQEVHTRNDVKFFPNATVAFNQTRSWQFRADLSHGSLDDEVTNLNTIAMTVGYALRYQGQVMHIIGEGLMNWAHEKLAVTHTVRSLIFDGYEDKILNLLKKLNLKQFNIPFEKFGWFVDRNGSSAYDGRFHMHTGEDQLKNLGLLQLWNGQSETAAFPGECGKVEGTTGEIFPPESDHSQPLAMFVGDVCRKIELNYVEEGKKFRVAGQLYKADKSVLDNGKLFPEMKCYCTADADQCPDLMPGVMNVSSCKFGAPAFLSFPHFYLADESYTDQVSGMDPNETKHEFKILMVRDLGIPLDVSAGMQINLLMDEYFDMGIFKGLPRKMMPMFWFRQRAEISEELAKAAFWASNALDIGYYFVYALASVGVFLMLLGVYLTVTRYWTRTAHDDVDELLTDE